MDMQTFGESRKARKVATSSNGEPGGLARAWSYWLEHPKLDLIAASAVTAAQWLASVRWDSFDVLGIIASKTPNNLPFHLIAAGAVVGLVNAFALSVLAIYREPRGRRLRLHRHMVGMVTTRSWLTATLGSVIVAFVMMAAGFLEEASLLGPGRWVVQLGMTFAVLTLPRLVWVLYDVLMVDATDATDRPGTPAPQFLPRNPDDAPIAVPQTRHRTLSEVTRPGE